MNINDNARSSASQCVRIKKWLECGKTLTSAQALKLFQCARLASRISDLKNQGLDIVSKRVQTSSGKWVAEYSIKSV